MLFRRSRAASGLALLALAAGFCVVLASTAATARASARRAMSRVFAWHLAKGLAVEFAATRCGAALEHKPLPELLFITYVVREHPEVRPFLANFEVTARSEGASANATVSWIEGGARRDELERARGREP